MPDSLIRTGGVGLGGGIVAAVVTALGFKARISTVEKALDKTMDRELCNERWQNIINRLDSQIHELEKQGKKLDKILEKVK